MGFAWRERRAWKTKTSSLGKYITAADATLFAIDMVMESLVQILLRADHYSAEIVTESRLALAAFEKDGDWTLPVVTDIREHTSRVEDAGGRVTLACLPNRDHYEGYKFADAAAQRAAKQQPKEVRSASLSYVKQAVKGRWKLRTKPNKYIEDSRKSIAARYLQLKSGHAITGAYLLRIGKVKDARCWWCGSSRQTVAHLMLQCRKWRRQRDKMLRDLISNKIVISARRCHADLKILFRDNAIEQVLRFIESTEVGKKLAGDADNQDSWDTDRLDQGDDEEGA